MVDWLNFGIFEQRLHRIEIARHEHLGITDYLLVDNSLVRKLNGRR